MSSNLFDNIKALLKGDEYAIPSVYQFNRALSFSPETFEISNAVNKRAGLSVWAIKALYDINVSGVGGYVKWIKKPKETEKKLIVRMAAYLGCSEKHSVETIKLLRIYNHHPERLFGLKEGE